MLPEGTFCFISLNRSSEDAMTRPRAPDRDVCLGSIHYIGNTPSKLLRILSFGAYASGGVV
jgi:hypothetical protein